MPSPAGTAARPCWRLWSGGTCSWSRSTTAASGTATTTSSPTCCRRTCWTSSPTTSPSCTGGRATWYEQNGEPSEAIRHALAAEDFDRAADLVELAMPAMRQDRQEATLRGWLEALPDEVLRVRPVLSIGYAGALLVTRRGRGRRGAPAGRRAVAGRRRPAQRPADPSSDRRWSSWTRRSSARLPGRDRRLPCRAGPVLGDVAGTMTHARRALDLVGEDDHLGRGAAAGAARDSRTGRAGISRQRTAVCRRHGESAAGRVHRRRCSAAPSPWRTSGSPRAVSARRCAPTSEACSSRPSRPAPLLRGTADMHVGHQRALPRTQRPRWPPCSTCGRAQELGEHTGLPQNPYRWRVAMARVRRGRGRSGRRSRPARRGGAPVRGRLLSRTCGRSRRCGHGCGSRRGRLGDALGWARERGLSVEDDLSYLREFEHVTLARVLLARHTSERAEGVRSTRRPDSWSAFCKRRKRGSGTGALSRSWCCRRLPTRREVTSRLRLPRWNAR